MPRPLRQPSRPHDGRRRAPGRPATLRDQGGQASAELVGLLLLVAAVLVAAAIAAAALAPGVGEAVLAQVRRALCLVTGSGCRPLDRRPCVVLADRTTRRLSATILLARLDEDHDLLRERLSDGTVRLTVVDRLGGGVEGGVGVEGAVSVGGRRFGWGHHVGAALLAVGGHGRVFLARSDREADRLTRELASGPSRWVPGAKAVERLLGGDDVPRPDATFLEGGATTELRGDLTVGALGVEARALVRGALGARHDHRTGATTYYLRHDRDGSLLASAAVLEQGAEAGARLDGESLVAVTVDRSGRPTEVALLAAGAVDAGAELDPLVAARLGVPPRAALGERRWELEARVALPDPVVSAALAAWRRDPLAPRAIDGLGAALAGRAQLDSRVFAVSRGGWEVSGGAGAGARAAGRMGELTQTSTLVAASSRAPGGAWEQRADCVRSG